MSATMDGKKICPGWEGNGFSCGRGSPRLIAESAEVCENCSRGLRKRGQQTREMEQEKIRRRQERIAEATRAAALIRKRAGLDAKPKHELASILEARKTLTRWEVQDQPAPRYPDDYNRRIYGPVLEDALYVLAGLDVPGGDE